MKRKAAYGTGHLRKRGDVWYVKIPTGGGQFIYRTSRDVKKNRLGTKQDALNLRDELLGKRHRGELAHQPGNATVNDILDHYLEVMRTQKLKSAAEVKLEVDLHLRPPFGTRRAESITTADLKKFRSRLTTGKDALSDTSVNRYFAYLRRAYNLAKLTSPPMVASAPSFVGLMTKEDNARQGFMTPAQYTTLLDKLPEYLRPLFVCAYWTGVRSGELLNLRWSQVELAEPGEIGAILLRTGETKSGEGRVVPIVPEMDTHLRRSRQWLIDHGYADFEWVFYRQDRDGLSRIQRFNKAWGTAVRGAGVKTEQGEWLRFHDLRRTATRNMTEKGLDPVDAMSITGHKTMSMFVRYNIASKDRALRAGRVMAGLEEPKRG